MAKSTRKSPSTSQSTRNSPGYTQSPSNALGTGQNLATFQISELAQYTKEQAYDTNASTMFHLFYVGRDDVHDILKYVLSRVTVSLYLNMYGYDDQELNDIIFAKALDPSVTMLITLDESQSNSKTEKQLLNSDIAKNPTAYNTHFVIGNSATNQISHTKGFVADGKVAGEGSTNWSTSGEGVFVVTGQPGGPGYKAQNNTQSIIMDPDTISRFTAELIAEHMAAKSPISKSPSKKRQ
jgi:phosphatidylserine/phosphatidylglycerophosphate/cardiolipin synthase-like enzyme